MPKKKSFLSRVEDLKRAWREGISAKVSDFQKKETDAAERLARKGLGLIGGEANRSYGDIDRERAKDACNLFAELVQKSGVHIESEEELEKILEVGMEIMEPEFKGMKARDLIAIANIPPNIKPGDLAAWRGRTDQVCCLAPIFCPPLRILLASSTGIDLELSSCKEMSVWHFGHESFAL